MAVAQEQRALDEKHAALRAEAERARAEVVQKLNLEKDKIVKGLRREETELEFAKDEARESAKRHLMRGQLKKTLDKDVKAMIDVVNYRKYEQRQSGGGGGSNAPPSEAAAEPRMDPAQFMRITRLTLDRFMRGMLAALRNDPVLRKALGPGCMSLPQAFVYLMYVNGWAKNDASRTRLCAGANGCTATQVAHYPLDAAKVHEFYRVPPSEREYLRSLLAIALTVCECRYINQSLNALQQFFVDRRALKSERDDGPDARANRTAPTYGLLRFLGLLSADPVRRPTKYVMFCTLKSVERPRPGAASAAEGLVEETRTALSAGWTALQFARAVSA